MEGKHLYTLREITLHYINKEKRYGKERKLYHYNCAEVLLNACNDYYNLEAGSKVLKAILPFGGGMYAEKTCGALTGSLASLGLIFAEEKPTSNNKLKEITNKWVLTFEKEFDTINCKQLKNNYRDPESGCEPLMLQTAELLELLIDQYR